VQSDCARIVAAPPHSTAVDDLDGEQKGNAPNAVKLMLVASAAPSSGERCFLSVQATAAPPPIMLSAELAGTDMVPPLAVGRPNKLK